MNRIDIASAYKTWRSARPLRLNPRLNSASSLSSCLGGVGAGAGALLVLVGGLVIYGWHAHLPALVQLRPSFVPMQYDTALGFISLGFALIFFSLRREGPARFFLLFPLLFGSLTALEILFNLDLGIDPLFFKPYLMVHTAKPGQAAPNTALCFLLSVAALAIMLHPSKRSHSISALLGSSLLALSGMALLGYMSGTPSAYGWGHFTNMAVRTGICFIIAGISLIALSWRESMTEDAAYPTWLPLSVGFSIALSVLIFSQALKAQARNQIRASLESEAAKHGENIQTYIDYRSRSLYRLTKRWEIEATAKPSNIDAEFDFLKKYRGFKALGWTDSRRRIVALLPDSEKRFAAAYRAALDAMDEKTLAKPRVDTSGPVFLLSSRKSGDAILASLAFRRHRFVSLLFGTIPFETIFKSAFNRRSPNDYYYNLSEGSKPLYKSDSINPHPNETVRVRIDLPGLTWTLETAPRANPFRSQQFLLCDALFVAGMLLSVAATLALRFALSADQRARSVRSANLRLESEISERKLAQDLLAEKERTLSDILDAMPVGVWFIDEEGRTLRSNPMARFIGTGDSEATERYEGREGVFSETGIPLRPEDWAGAKTLASGAPRTNEAIDIVRRDGAARTIRDVAVPLFNPEGERIGALVVNEDITDRREAEMKVARINRLYSVLSRINEAIVRIREPSPLYQEACRIAVEIGGFSMAVVGLANAETGILEPVAYRGGSDAILESIRNSFRSSAEERGPMGQAALTGESVTINEIEDSPVSENWRDAARSHGFRSVGGFPLRANGVVVGAIGFNADRPDYFNEEERRLLDSLAEDLSFALDGMERDRDRKLMEEAIRSSESELRTLISCMEDSLFVFDADGRIRSANPRNRYGSPDALIGRTVASLVEPELADAFLERIRSALKTGLTERWEYSHALQGADRWFSANVTPMDDSKVLWVARDITGRKRREAEQARLAQELARSNEDLERFAYMASHDLQEPLRMISGYLQLIERRYADALDDSAREFIRYAMDGSVRMRNLIDDLLLYSRVNSDRLSFDLIDAGDALGFALKNLEVAFREHDASVDAEPLPQVYGNQAQITLLFQNLINNALKFHSEEPIRIVIRVHSSDEERIFSVKDNGIGFDPKWAERIFMIFQRLRGRSEYPGSGIGLATCKRIIERHEGRIWAESEPGKGSVFYFALPRKKVS